MRLGVNQKQTKRLSVILLPGHERVFSFSLKWASIYAGTIILSVLSCVLVNFVTVSYPTRAHEFSMLMSTGTGRLSYLLSEQIAYVKSEEMIYSESATQLLEATKQLESKDKTIREKDEIAPQYKTLKEIFNSKPYRELATNPQLSDQGSVISAKAATILQKIDSTTHIFAQAERITDNLYWLRTHTPNCYPVPDGETRDHNPGFGYRIHPIWGTFDNHTGIDIEGKLGEPIYAVADGVVTRAKLYGGYGRCIDILHRKDEGGIVSRYGHCDEIVVKEGDMVKRGDLIGYVGSTGTSTGPHIHFEITIDNRPTDPDEYIRNVNMSQKYLKKEVPAQQKASGGK